MMVGEEGDENPGFAPEPIGPPEVTTKMIGEEGDEKPEPPTATTMAIGEEGEDPGLIDPDTVYYVGGPDLEPVDGADATGVDLGFGAGAPEPVAEEEPDPAKWETRIVWTVTAS